MHRHAHIHYKCKHASHTSTYAIILNKNFITCNLLVPCFMSWNKRSQKCSIRTKSLFPSNFVNTFVYIPVSEHFSITKIIHPPVRFGMSGSWINSIFFYTGAPCARDNKRPLLNVQFCHTTQCHRCPKFWGSIQLAYWLQEWPPDLLPENLMLISLP